MSDYIDSKLYMKCLDFFVFIINAMSAFPESKRTTRKSAERRRWGGGETCNIESSRPDISTFPTSHLVLAVSAP